jgi:hypothetical protein
MESSAAVRLVNRNNAAILNYFLDEENIAFERRSRGRIHLSYSQIGYDVNHRIEAVHVRDGELVVERLAARIAVTAELLDEGSVLIDVTGRMPRLRHFARYASVASAIVSPRGASGLGGAVAQ